MRQVRIIVNKDLCKGCEICMLFCPAKILEEDTPTAWGGSSPRLAKGGETKCMLVRGPKGVACRLCEKRCPDAAIMVEVQEK
jgi:2-oxoglutarate ferredoxin oxidoreductase subunit delta